MVRRYDIHVFLICTCGEEGLILTSVGVTGSNLSDPRAVEIWDNILERVRKYDDILRAQLFTVDFEDKVISFYVVLDYNSKTREATLRKFEEELAGLYPDMSFEIHESIDL